ADARRYDDRAHRHQHGCRQQHAVAGAGLVPAGDRLLAGPLGDDQAALLDLEPRSADPEQPVVRHRAEEHLRGALRQVPDQQQGEADREGGRHHEGAQLHEGRRRELCVRGRGGARPRRPHGKGDRNAKVTKNLNASDAPPDPKARIKLVNAADAQLAKDVPTIPLYQKPTYFVFKTSLKGLVDNPTLQGPTWNTEAWKAG